MEVWQDARHPVKEAFQLSKLLPDSEKYGLVSQINRCAVSIPANIAEGCAKYSQKDFVRFLQISLGSTYKLKIHFTLCADLQFIRSEKSAQIIETVQRLQKRISSLIKYNNS